MGIPARRLGDNVAVDPTVRPWLSAESYWHPPRIVPSGWLEHAPFAAWIMAALRPTTFVELGTHNGYSFFSFCEAAQRLGLSTTCYAIDSWEGDDHAGFYSEAVYTDVKSVADELYPGTAVLMRGYFDDFVGSFAEASIDLLHIDGRHGYEDVRHDFESWLPKVANGGVVLFHDVVVKDRDFGVWKFWNELSKRYPSFSFTHGNGLGVIAVGTVPPGVKSLFDASAAETRKIRDFYARRGSVMAAEYGEIMARTQERDELLTSFAWRATKPLRALTGLVPEGIKSRLRGSRERPDSRPST